MSHMTWLIAGVIFIALEVVLPGGIVAALGVSTLLIALLVWLEVLTTFGHALIIWTILVIASLLVLRPIMRKLYPSQTTKGSFEEDDDLRGTVVPVTEMIPAGNGEGRILVRGTTWQASFIDPAHSAEVGASVKLASRNNILWFVEPVTTTAPKGENR